MSSDSVALAGVLVALVAASGCGDCDDEGCVSGVNVMFADQISGAYRLEVEYQDKKFSSDCPATIAASSAGGLSCHGSGFTISASEIAAEAAAGATVALKVSITLPDGRQPIADQVVQARYGDSPVNGSGCAMRCFRANATL